MFVFKFILSPNLIFLSRFKMRNYNNGLLPANSPLVLQLKLCKTLTLWQTLNVPKRKITFDEDFGGKKATSHDLG